MWNRVPRWGVWAKRREMFDSEKNQKDALPKSLEQRPKIEKYRKLKSAKGASYNSLGQRPRNQRKERNGALKGRPQLEDDFYRGRLFLANLSSKQTVG